MQGHGFKIGEGLSRRFTILREPGRPSAPPTDKVRRRMLADAASTATGGFAGLALGFQEAHSFWPWTRAKGRRLIADSLRDLAEAGVALFAFADAERRGRAARPIPEGGAVDLRDMRDFIGERGGETVVPFPFVVHHRDRAETRFERPTFDREEVEAFLGGSTGGPVTLETLFGGEECLFDAGRFPDAEGRVSDRPFGGAVVHGDPVTEAALEEDREIARLARSFDDGPLASVRRAGLQSDGGSPT